MKNNKAITVLCWLQSIYFLITGIWPFIHLESFLMVTGPKNDIWLLKTVSVLILAVGLSLLTAAKKHEINTSILILAISSALGLAGIDIYYASTDIIWDIYLADAVAEIVIVAAWLILWFKRNNK